MDETKKIILDALGEANDENNEESIGKPAEPVLPLVGSMNVPISPKEEETVEQ